MKLSDHLDQDTKRALNKIGKRKNKKSPTKKKRNNEKLSPNDLNELMGVNRQTYKRGKGGAIKRR